MTEAGAAARPDTRITRPQLHYIDGAFVESRAGTTFETLSPTGNQPLAVVADGNAEDIASAVAAARRAFDEGPWPRMKATERAAVLRRIARAIREDASELVRLEVLDVGMPIRQMRQQADRAADNFDFFATAITELAGRAYENGTQFLNYTRHRPVGVAGLITPWNSPLMLSTWKIAPCLAAGNTCVLKPAEWSPLTATRLAELLDDVGLPQGVFNVVRLGRDGRRAARGACGRELDLVHRGDDDGERDRRERRANAEALLDGARRQVAGGRVRRLRRRARGRRDRLPDLHAERPALRRGRGSSSSSRSTTTLSPPSSSAPPGSASVTPSTSAPSSGR